MKKLVLITLLFCNYFAYGQSAVYTLNFGSVEIGELKVQQSTKNGMTTIDVQSEATVSVGFKYKVSYHQKTVYKEGMLMNAEVEIYKNDELYNSATTNWEGSFYKINHNGKKLKLDEPIHFSSTKLYFSEPENIESLYSESDCEVRPVKKMTEHTYRVSEVHSKRKNDYTFKNGVLHEGTIHHTLINFHVKLKSYNP